MKLKALIELPLFNAWRLGLALPMCLSVAFWVNHWVLGRDGLDGRALWVLGLGFTIAEVSLLLSKQLSRGQKFSYALFTLEIYPLLFFGFLILGGMLDFLHCGLEGTK